MKVLIINFNWKYITIDYNSAINPLYLVRGVLERMETLVGKRGGRLPFFFLFGMEETLVVGKCNFKN